MNAELRRWIAAAVNYGDSMRALDGKIPTNEAERARIRAHLVAFGVE